jgi:hypothetical protein
MKGTVLAGGSGTRLRAVENQRVSRASPGFTHGSLVLSESAEFRTSDAFA